MRHNLTLTGYACCFRPVNPGDAAEIVLLRRDPRNSRFLNKTSPVIADQVAWLEAYFERSGDWYFVIETLDAKRTVGLVGIYDHDPVAKSAEWGRWIVREDSGAAVESLWLVYRVAFEVLRLESVYCRTLAENHQVVSLHDSSGALRVSPPTDAGVIDFADDKIEHRVDRNLWSRMEPRLSQLARMVAARTRRE